MLQQDKHGSSVQDQLDHFQGSKYFKNNMTVWAQQVSKPVFILHTYAYKAFQGVKATRAYKPTAWEFLTSDKEIKCAAKTLQYTRSTKNDSDTVPFGIFAYFIYKRYSLLKSVNLQ